MTKALFAIESSHEENLPPMEVIQYIDAGGNLCGGWWIGAGEAPSENSVLVVVDSTDDMLNEMANNPQYLYLGDIVEDGGLNG